MASIFRPIHAVLCDDVRQEDNGKGILIGVYSGNILVPCPANAKMAFWIEGEISECGEPTVQFQTELLDSDGKSYVTGVTGNVSVDARDEKHGIVILNSVIPIQKNGFLTLSAKDDGQLTEIFRKKVIVSSNDSLQPLKQ